MENKVSIESEVREYMKNKYGEDFLESFKILGTGGQSMFAKHVEIRAVSSRFPGEIITIKKYPPKKFGKKHPLFLDDYLEICRREEISAGYAKIFEGIFENYKVRMHALAPAIVILPDELRMDTPFEEIIKNKDIRPNINIFTTDNINDSKEKIDKIYLVAKNQNICVNVDLRYLKILEDNNTEYKRAAIRIGYTNFDFKIDWYTK